MITESKTVVELTDIAKEKIMEIMAQYGEELVLRILVQGGCCGFQMGMTLDKKVNDDDVVVDTGNFMVAIDPNSFEYVKGSKIDFDETGSGGFVIDNPFLREMAAQTGAACSSCGPATGGCGCC